MVTMTVKPWNETAFIDRAVPELASALGLHLVLDNLGRKREAASDIALIDPEVVEQLRTDWISRAASSFSPEWHATIENQVASAENFRLALVARLDQVRLARRLPAWVKLCRAIAVALAVLTLSAIAVIALAPLDHAAKHAVLLVSELAPLGAGLFAIASAIGRERFNEYRAARISTRLRQELRLALAHGFGRPISAVAGDLDSLSHILVD